MGAEGCSHAPFFCGMEGVGEKAATSHFEGSCAIEGASEEDLM